jgi:5-hydroxyisourate hydrolase
MAARETTRRASASGAPAVYTRHRAVSPITTHILDVSLGRPAHGVDVTLEQQGADGWNPVGQGATDADGRIRDLLAGALEAGTYRLTFHTGAYFQARGVDGFYPEVAVTFCIRAPGEHYHVPLLLSPFGYSTYRGS